MLEVREALGGEQLNPSSVYFAPGGSHLRLAGDAKLLVSAEEPMDGLRPRADLTVSDAARIFGERLVLVVVSGMGKDGVDGAREVKERGGRVPRRGRGRVRSPRERRAPWSRRSWPTGSFP